LTVGPSTIAKARVTATPAAITIQLRAIANGAASPGWRAA
jgi:hypothetical protein